MHYQNYCTMYQVIQSYSCCLSQKLLVKQENTCTELVKILLCKIIIIQKNIYTQKLKQIVHNNQKKNYGNLNNFVQTVHN